MSGNCRLPWYPGNVVVESFGSWVDGNRKNVTT